MYLPFSPKERRRWKISAPELTLVIIFTLLCLYLFMKPLGFIFRVIIRGTVYSVLVWSINLITAPMGFTIGINAVSSLIFGILGIYGVGAGYLAGVLYSLKL